MAAELSSPVAGIQSGREIDNDVPSDPRQRAELLRDSREYLVARMCDLVSAALLKIADELTDTALRSVNRGEQQAMMDAVTLVRRNRSEFESSFRSAFVDCFERRMRGEVEKSVEVIEGELSLIDDSVLSNKLTVDRLVHRTRGRLDPDEVLGMRARLAALLEREWFDESQHPAAPEAIFEALKQAVSQLSAEPDVQAALLDAFEPHVSASLNQVYSKANARLREHNVMPKIRRQVVRSRQGDGRSGRPGAADDHAGMPAQAGGHGSLQDGASGQPHGPVNNQEFHEVVARFNATLEQLGQGLPAARESVARMLTDPEGFGMADLPMPLVQTDLLQSLTRLQNISMGQAMPAAATEQLMARVNDQAQNQAKDRGSPLDQLTVEIVSMVFDYINADPRIADAVKQQLLRLQVVAIKAALIDRSFFARRAHPMRRLIDRITELATDPDVDLSADAPMTKDLGTLIGWVQNSFQQDLATFDEALCRLEALAEKEQQRRGEKLVQVTADAERIDLLAQEKAKAHSQLLHRCEESTPAFLKTFLLDWWSAAMAELTQSSDPQRMRPAEALQVAEALIWSVAPKSADEIVRLASMLPKVLKGLASGLKLIQLPDLVRQAFFNELLRVHTAAISTAKSPHNSQSQRMAVFNATAKVRLRSDGELHFQPTRNADGQPSAPPPPIEVAAVAQARAMLDHQVKRGDRIEIDEDDGASRFKLAWISPSQKLYVLSRHPGEARSLDAVAFAELFSSGRARVLGRRSSIDSAMSEIVREGKDNVLSKPPAARTAAIRSAAHA